MLPCFLLVPNIPCLRDFWVWDKCWYYICTFVLLLQRSHFLVPQTGNLNTHLLPPNSPPPTRLEGLVHRGLPNTPRDLFKQTGHCVCPQCSPGLAEVTWLWLLSWPAETSGWPVIGRDQTLWRGLLPKSGRGLPCRQKCLETHEQF